MLNEKAGKGIGILACYVVAFILVFFLVGFIAAAVWIWGMVAANNDAHKWNRAHGAPGEAAVPGIAACSATGKALEPMASWTTALADTTAIMARSLHREYITRGKHRLSGGWGVNG
jgi:hypothetical protein